MNREAIYTQINIERARQDQKFGRLYNENGQYIWPSTLATKFLVLGEEVGEVANAILEWDLDNLKAELIQVAAVCVAFLEAEY